MLFVNKQTWLATVMMSCSGFHLCLVTAWNVETMYTLLFACSDLHDWLPQFLRPVLISMGRAYSIWWNASYAATRTSGHSGFR